MKPRSAKAKGSRLEKKVMQMLAAIPGWTARKQPGSGIYQSFPHDVFATDPLRRDWVVECKKWKNGWRTGDKAMGQADILVIERDYGEPCVYMPMAKFVEMVGPLEGVSDD